MEEPTVISYNVKAAQSVYIFWLIMPNDMGVLGPGAAITLGLLNSYFLFFCFCFAFVAYILVLRAGRPRGYDIHLFATIANPLSYIRPGPSECPQPFIRSEPRVAEPEFQ